MIRGMIYVGGGETQISDRCLIHEYSPADDEWSTLPPIPVYFFGMGELNGELVIVGGKTRYAVVTGKVYTFDCSSQNWKECIPPMPTALHSPAVFSQPSCLTVVGGKDEHDIRLSEVQVFIPQISQWQKASPAPSPLSFMTSAVIHNKCFVAEYVSTKVYQLSVSVHQTTESLVTPQVIIEWEDIPHLPYQGCALGSLNGCLLAVGGGEWRSLATTVHCYTPITKTWSRVGDLPESRCYCTAIPLPSGELLVMGGKAEPWSPSIKKVWRAAAVQ